MKYFSNQEQKFVKKTSKSVSVLKTITFYLENDNHEEVSFNQKTLTFTLKMIKLLNELSKN